MITTFIWCILYVLYKELGLLFATITELNRESHVNIAINLMMCHWKSRKTNKQTTTTGKKEIAAMRKPTKTTPYYCLISQKDLRELFACTVSVSGTASLAVLE